MNDAYFTIRTESRVEIKVKDSRFIGETRRVTSVDHAVECLNETRKRESEVNDNSSGIRVGPWRTRR